MDFFGQLFSPGVAVTKAIYGKWQDRRNQAASADAAYLAKQARLVLIPHPGGGLGKGAKKEGVEDSVWVHVRFANEGSEASNLRLHVTGNGKPQEVEGSPKQRFGQSDGEAGFLFRIPLVEGRLPEPEIRFVLRFTFQDDSWPNRDREQCFCHRFKGGLYPHEWREWAEDCN